MEDRRRADDERPVVEDRPLAEIEKTMEQGHERHDIAGARYDRVSRVPALQGITREAEREPRAIEAELEVETDVEIEAR